MPARRITAWLAPLFVLLLLPFLATAREVTLEKVQRDALSVISRKRAVKHLLFLANKCEGRASGEKGCDKAAEYISKVFEEVGVEPHGDEGGYLQTFTIETGPFPGQSRRKKGQAYGPRPTSNVIGVVKGSDPELSKQVMVLGAHYDHIGYRDLRKRKIYWGADDNASGTTAVMLVAEAFARGELKPRRSVMFILFSGEERGLFGSKHYVARPTWPIADTVAMINLDMVGRNEASRLDVYGNRSSPELDEANSKHEKASKFKFRFKGGSVFSRSDHFPFYKRNIPVLFFNSGLHKDYHSLGDEPKRINWGKLERSAEHCYRVLWEIGEQEKRPTFKEIAPSGAAGVLGLVPVPIPPEELEAHKLKRGKGAVAVTDVMRGTPAEKAGVKVGDLVLGLAGKYLTDEDPMGELDQLAEKMEKRKKYPLLLKRDGKKKTVTVKIE
ncbi:MAG: M28 family peptidase [Planctomycetota bacterium]|jgi:hypothetical protein